MTSASQPINAKKILLIIAITGLSAMFLALSIAYIYTRVQNNEPPVRVPILFAVNTAILLAAGWFFKQAQYAFLEGSEKTFKKNLSGVLVLTVLFLIGQIVAWFQLYASIHPLKSHSADYLYVISALHYAHILAGIPFLLVFLFRMLKQLKDSQNYLLYFSDDSVALSLWQLRLYWRFLDILWLYIFLFFIINMMIPASGS